MINPKTQELICQLTLHVDLQAEDIYTQNYQVLRDMGLLYRISFNKYNFVITEFHKKISTYFSNNLNDANSIQGKGQVHQINIKSANDQIAFNLIIKLLFGFQNIDVHKSSFVQFFVIFEELGIKTDRMTIPNCNSKFQEALMNAAKKYIENHASLQDCYELLKRTIKQQKGEKLIEACHNRFGLKEFIPKIIQTPLFGLDEKEFINLVKIHKKLKYKSTEKKNFLDEDGVINLVISYPSINNKQKLMLLEELFPLNEPIISHNPLMFMIESWRKTCQELKEFKQKSSKQEQTAIAQIKGLKQELNSIKKINESKILHLKLRIQELIAENSKYRYMLGENDFFLPQDIMDIDDPNDIPDELDYMINEYEKSQNCLQIKENMKIIR